MFYNNNIRIIFNVFYLISASAWASAAESASALAGGWPSVLPPLLAVVFALVFRSVLPALFLAIWLGAWLLNDLSLAGLGAGLLDTFEGYVRTALADSDHAAIILFSLMIGGMVGIISRNGGMQGIVNLIVGWANTVRHTTMAATAMGIAIFFDDYANTLVVGNAMRPVTDAMRVSRAKLAYIVDSTAAPVACIALVTTWVGYEVGLIGSAMDTIPGLDLQPYLVFVNTIPYSFYPILAIFFVAMVSWTGRDFGPMLKAERLAREHGVEMAGHLQQTSEEETEAIEPMHGKPQRAVNALLPVLVLLGAVIVSLYLTGRKAVGPGPASLHDIVGAADAYTSLMWSSLLGMVTAAGLSMAQGILKLEEVVSAWYKGLRAMIKAIIILLLAWALGEVTAELGTAQFLVSVLGEALPAFVLPALVFVLAAATGFGTGSSWGSMAILIPLVVPLTWAVMVNQGGATHADMHILYSSIASVLAGSVWGDHCSPISDTTILSSLASGCDHVEHVRTQLPYAGVVGLVAVVAGSLLVGLGLPWWGGLTAGAVILAIVLRLFGRHSDPA